MKNPAFHHVLFDLGGTLMHALEDWAPVFLEGDMALTKKLAKHNIQLDPVTFRSRIHEYYAQRDKDFHESTYHFVLRELLTELGSKNCQGTRSYGNHYKEGIENFARGA